MMFIVRRFSLLPFFLLFYWRNEEDVKALSSEAAISAASSLIPGPAPGKSRQRSIWSSVLASSVIEVLLLAAFDIVEVTVAVVAAVAFC